MHVRDIILTLLLFVLSGQAAAKKLTAEDVLANIRSKGAAATIEKIWMSKTEIEQLMSGIGSADKKWLQVANALAPGADGEGAESINDALSIALINAPYRVLPLVKQKWWNGAAGVCIFDYDNELPGGVENYIERLENSLKKTPPQRLRESRNACLKGIMETKERLKNAAN